MTENKKYVKCGCVDPYETKLCENCLMDSETTDCKAGFPEMEIYYLYKEVKE